MGNSNGQKKFKEEEDPDLGEKQAMIIGGNGTTAEGWSSPGKRNSQTKYAPLSVSILLCRRRSAGTMNVCVRLGMACK